MWKFLLPVMAVVLVLGMIVSGPVRAQEPLVWVEGEQATHKQVIDNAGLNNTDPEELSGGAWLSSFANKGQTTGTADYDVTIPQTGHYHFWLHGTTGSALSYRWDTAGKWVPVDSAKVTQASGIGADGNPYFPQVGWYDLGTIDLTKGKHNVAWDLGGQTGDGRFAAIDAFVLTTGDFTPNGRYKPGEKPTNRIPFYPGHTWEFDPGMDTTPDPLASSAVLDLRYLNETTAGQHGFIRTSKDGNSFVRGDGQPIRFWGESEYAQETLTLDELKRHAQFLAKHGINVVRVHTQIMTKTEGAGLTDTDPTAIDNIYKLVAAMKTAGIYTVISPYWGVHVTLLKSWGVPSPGHDTADGMVFFDPTLQKGYRAWVKTLYTKPNPYTGIRLADDPAVAVIQLQNEDSLLFWTGSNYKGPALDELRHLYADFLVKKYGSLDKALAAWKGYNAEFIPDDMAHNLPGLLHNWDFTRDGMAKKGTTPGFRERAADQLEFIAGTMHKFNADTVDFLRKEVGCKQLINPGNWRTVDTTLLQDAEYWSYTPGEVIARNFYTGGFHNGVNAGWQVLTGSYYTNVSMTKQPIDLPINVKQPAGYPFMVPETLWTPPDLYSAEGPLMLAAQQALTGVDITFWFSNAAREWDHNPIAKWTFSTPTMLGQFPAAALIYRTGLVKAGQPAVVEQRTLQNVWDRTTPIISEESGWDINRDAGNIALTSSVKTAVDPLAYLVGPVQVVYGGDPAKTSVLDLSRYIDRTRQTVTSDTGEITTDYKTGLYKVNAPMAQAVAGFLKAAGPQHLADVDITSGNDYGTVAVVPLDGKPLRTSAKVLVQVGTEARPTGWVDRPARIKIGNDTVDGFRIIETGKSPYQVVNTDATVAVRNPSLTKATLLDINGMATTTPVPVKRSGGRISVVLPPNTMYLVLTGG